VSPGLVIVVPTRPTSWLVVTAQDGRVCYAPLRMASVSPAILYAGLEDQRDLDGQLPLALWRSGKLAPRVLDGEGVPASTEGAPTVLAIQGTGWRNAGNDIRVTLGGVACAVLASGPSAVFGGESAGQDQAAIEIPVALTQRGPLDLVIEAAGQRSNIARVCVRD
jgi:uncharacterized protein (TIGR03437 family)